MVLQRGRAEELFVYVKGKRLNLFEGIKMAYCSGFHKLLGKVCSGIIGGIRYVEACYIKLSNRELTDNIYGGSFTELGSYVMLPVHKIWG